jgi:hypothetical protein
VAGGDPAPTVRLHSPLIRPADQLPDEASIAVLGRLAGNTEQLPP